MAILVPRWLNFSWQVRLQMCLKFCMVKVVNCMGSPNEQYRNWGIRRIRSSVLGILN
jgi:hypothetical protein